MSTNPSITAILQGACGYCGGYHIGMCPRIRSVEYHQDGTTKRVEFHDSRPSWPTEAREAAEHSGGVSGG